MGTLSGAGGESCAICVEGYSSDPHCQDCHRTWTAKAEAHCAGCCRHFTSDNAFDRHLASVTSDDTCHDPGTILRKDGGPVLEVFDRWHGPVLRVAGNKDGRFAPSHLSQEPLAGLGVDQ